MASQASNSISVKLAPDGWGLTKPLEQSLISALSSSIGPLQRINDVLLLQLTASGFPGQQPLARTHIVWVFSICFLESSGAPCDSSRQPWPLTPWPPEMSNHRLSPWVALVCFSRWNASCEGESIGLNASLEKPFSLLYKKTTEQKCWVHGYLLGLEALSSSNA